MTHEPAQLTVSMTAEQINATYLALSPVPTECRAEMQALYEEHNAEWKYQLPNAAYARMDQLERREMAAIQALGILAASRITAVPTAW